MNYRTMTMKIKTGWGKKFIGMDAVEFCEKHNFEQVNEVYCSIEDEIEFPIEDVKNSNFLKRIFRNRNYIEISLNNRNDAFDFMNFFKDSTKMTFKDCGYKIDVNLNIAYTDKFLEKLEELLNVLKKYIAKTNRRITFEYIMLERINDTKECAIELANILKGMNCYVNLIPYNETENIEFKRTKKMQILTFYDILKKNLEELKRKIILTIMLIQIGKL